MHELSLCMALIDLIDRRARSDGFARVRRVILEIGALSHVEPEAMAFGFEVAARGSAAEGALLEIQCPAGQAWCVDCETDQRIARRGDGCPACGGHKLMVTGGDELKLKELEVV